MTDGGEGVSGRRFSHSENTKQLISKTKKKNPTKYWLNKKRDIETGRKISEANTGRVHSKEHRKKVSDKITELWKNPVWKNKMIEARNNRKSQ